MSARNVSPGSLFIEECDCDEACIKEISASFELLTPTVELAIGIPYIILIILSSITNLAIIIAIVNTEKLKTTQNYLIANLAISDLLVCMFCMPSTLISLLNEGQWSLGYLLCKVRFTFKTIYQPFPNRNFTKFLTFCTL